LGKHHKESTKKGECGMTVQSPENLPAQKPYQAPQIVLEFELETRAGSPVGLPDLQTLEEEATP